jgi:hypothetical protein
MKGVDRRRVRCGETEVQAGTSVCRHRSIDFGDPKADIIRAVTQHAPGFMLKPIAEGLERSIVKAPRPFQLVDADGYVIEHDGDLLIAVADFRFPASSDRSE